MATVLEPKLEQGAATASSDRSFGLLFAAVFACIAGLPLFHHEEPRWWAVAVALAFAIAALARPRLLGPLNRAWTFLGNMLHHVVSPIIMGAVFFLCVTPTAWIMRRRGKDLLSLAPRPDLKSYWIEKPPSRPPAESMTTQF